MSTEKRCYFFSPEQSDADMSYRNLLGGKGANLAEMCATWHILAPAAAPGLRAAQPLPSPAPSPRALPPRLVRCDAYRPSPVGSYPRVVPCAHATATASACGGG